MMKKWMGKKQVLMGALVVALGLAVYLNYHFATQNPLSAASGTTAKTTISKNLGDSKFVGATTAANATKAGTATSEYFSAARKNRTAARDEAVEIIEDILAQPTVTDELSKQASAKLETLTNAIKQESDIETLLAAKGFSECLVFIDGDNAHVTVRSPKLTAKQSLQILDVVTAHSDISAEKVNIVAVN